MTLTHTHIQDLFTLLLMKELRRCYNLSKVNAKNRPSIDQEYRSEFVNGSKIEISTREEG